ncbi:MULTISPECIES: threonine aldolase family protein [Clostridium]|uniref:threonine aldolase family protein n=1 Tax=Clostridium TaxID=1485 RepID=UPI0003FDE358|nr:aminotransferase class I/II-fold pyridoxal phosphate-dependent enzyme [Clostridium cadaveris]MDU4952270.1 beta-eliminating lyase-related protein [Clostridium sp.]
MYSFKNDYSEGAHERIIKAIVETNYEQTEGYGLDIYCDKARSVLKKKINYDKADIHFLVGGTQTNLTAISAFLRPHEAVIAANSGHVLVHETGAIEATGHKVISVAVNDGKLKPCHIQSVVDEHTDEHMVKPRMVYISDSTEIGSIYTKSELIALKEECKKNHLYLYLDGARIGAALKSEENDLKLSDMPQLTDAFYIGGTKGGALMGEAIVICNEELKSDFRFFIKQKGAMLAKGRLLGIQFYELFKDDLYFDLANHANNMAAILKKGIKELGYDFMIETSTNQIFPILPNEILEKINLKYEYSVWQKWDDRSKVIRLVTSWATLEEKVREFIDDLKSWSL